MLETSAANPTNGKFEIVFGQLREQAHFCKASVSQLIKRPTQEESAPGGDGRYRGGEVGVVAPGGGRDGGWRGGGPGLGGEVRRRGPEHLGSI